MKGVIIAAGYGSRLWDVSDQVPKTLLPFGKGTILSSIINSLTVAGITEIILVVGFNQQYIREYIASHNFPLPIRFVENTEWDKGNGLSVYKVKEAVNNESFILSMSDHIVRPEAVAKIISSPESANLLLVDPFPKEIFDIDDATKVRVENDFLVQIGKEISDYNCIDCGIFRLNNNFFTAFENALLTGKDSISAGISQLIDQRIMKAVFTDKPFQWLDIDTPEAYAHAKENISSFGL